MMRYYSGAAAADRLGIFLVPGSVVQPIIGEAIDQAVKVAADRARTRRLPRPLSSRPNTGLRLRHRQRPRPSRLESKTVCPTFDYSSPKFRRIKNARSPRI